MFGVMYLVFNTLYTACRTLEELRVYRIHTYPNFYGISLMNAESQSFNSFLFFLVTAFRLFTKDNMTGCKA